MLKKSVTLFAVVFVIVILSQKSSFAAVDYDSIITAESDYIASCVTSSGAIIMGPSSLYTFKGTAHYKICPYFSNFAATALLDNPTSSNLAIVKNWMTWVFNHLNSDGSIYDYFVDSLNGGTEYPSTDADSSEGIDDFDSQDSYAATFLTLARRYAEVVPADTSWLRGYSYQLELIGNALYAVVDDENHQFDSDNDDGLTVAKLDYQIKYTMDNSEVNMGLKDMVWLQQNVSSYNSPSYYQALLDDNTDGFDNLWDSTASAYYAYEGISAPNWSTFYPDAVCQLYPIWTEVISSSSSRATNLYNTFNSYYTAWQNGTYYDPYPWAIICYVAAVMNDTARVNSYLSYIESVLDAGQTPSYWYNMEAAFTLRAAKVMSELTSSSSISGVNTESLQQSLTLENYPNPFNPSTKIRFSLPETGMVTLKVYNIVGQEIKTLINREMSAGSYDVNFNASNLASGVYIYSISAGAYHATKKMMLLK